MKRLLILLLALVTMTALPGQPGMLLVGDAAAPPPPSADTCGAFVAAGVWKSFMCHNLGANTAAVPTTPSWELVGNYYQWGRNPTCFGIDGIDAPNPCSNPVYGAAGPFGSTAATDNEGSITGWSTFIAPNGSWAAEKTANDPCPAGHRVITSLEAQALINTTLNTRTLIGSFTTSSTNYSSGFLFGTSLFLPMGGLRNNNTGALDSRGSFGQYWTSNESGTSNAAYLNIYSPGTVNTTSANRNFGMSIRCIKE